MIPPVIRLPVCLCLGMTCQLLAAASPVLTPSQFVPVDTSTLMVSRLPYRLENAFPNVSFHEDEPVQVIPWPDSSQGESDHLVVVCHNGKVFRIASDAGATEKQLFLDLSPSLILEGDEHGILGFTFTPSMRRTARSMPPTRHLRLTIPVASDMM